MKSWRLVWPFVGKDRLGIIFITIAYTAARFEFGSQMGSDRIGSCFPMYAKQKKLDSTFQQESSTQNKQFGREKNPHPPTFSWHPKLFPHCGEALCSCPRCPYEEHNLKSWFKVTCQYFLYSKWAWVTTGWLLIKNLVFFQAYGTVRKERTAFVSLALNDFSMIW